MAKRKPARPGPRPIEVAKADRSRQDRSAPTSATVTSGGFRATFERLSAGPMVRLGMLPTALLPTLMLAFLLFGMLLPANWAGLALVLVGLFLTWLTALSWPATSIGWRMVRVLVNLALVVTGILRVVGLIG